jgi:hypothetical protein
LPPSAPGVTIPGGELAAPPVRAFGSPDRPPLGTAPPPCLRHRLPLPVWQRARLLKKSFSSGRAAAKNSEEWRAIRLRIVRRYRNRPEGGMLTTEYYAMVCTVESHPCPARRRRGKRALLGGLCGAVAVEWALRARKSRFWRLVVENHHPHPLRAL